MLQESIEGHLNIQLEHCERKMEADCPLLIPKLGVDALHSHCALAEELNSRKSDGLLGYSSQVWNLCVALWGSLPDLGNYWFSV